MSKSPHEHARNWDLRHEDFNDPDLLYEVYSVMRQRAPIAHTEAPFFPTDGAWVALGYDECYRIAQDWEHFSSNPTPEGARQAGGDLVITLDPPRQQKFRKVLNPYFSPARMKALTPQIRAETDLLIDAFPDPDRCVLDRSANRHLGFGAGVHRCLGSNLARLEFAIGLEQVLARLPDVGLDPGGTAVFHGNSVTRGYRRIPVVFSPSEPVVLRGPNDSVLSRG